MLDQQGQVVFALGQGRNVERHHIDPKKQILPEMPQSYLLRQVPVGGGKKTDIDLDRRNPAEMHHLFFLDHPKELHLHGRRHLRDLVEKKGAAIGHLHQPFLHLHRPGKSALLMAKELVCQQVLLKSAAIHGKQGAVAPVAAGMNKPGQQLLTRARLPADHHIAVRGGHLSGRSQQLFHPRVVGDDPGLALKGLEVLPQPAVFLLESGFFQSLPHHLPDLIQLVGLGDIMVGPSLHGLDGGIHRGVAGNHDHLGIGVQLPGALQDLHTADLFHLQVGQDKVKDIFLQQMQGARAALGGSNLVALFFQNMLEVVQGYLFVVNDQYSRCFVRHDQFPAAFPAAI